MDSLIEKYEELIFAPIHEKAKMVAFFALPEDMHIVEGLVEKYDLKATYESREYSFSDFILITIEYGYSTSDLINSLLSKT